LFNINTKSVLYFFIFTFLVATGILYYTLIIVDAKKEANERIETILEQHKALHSYIENRQKPVIYNLKEKGILKDDYFNPKILSFTYIARNIHDIYKHTKEKKNQEPYQYKLASINPRNPVNKASVFESEILEKFRTKQLSEFNSVIDENGRKYYYKAIPLSPNKASCMRCHSIPEVAPKQMINMYGNQGGFGEKVNEIRAMISLKIPITELYNQSIKQFIFLSLMIFIILTILYLLIHRIIKQTEQLENEIQKNKEKDAILAEQSKMGALGEMIGNIAHQWRQPLSVISTASTGMLLQKQLGTLDEDQLCESLKKINDTTQHMSQTIDSFRDFIKGDIKKIPFNLADEIKSCLIIEDGIIKQNNIVVTTTLDESIEIINNPHGLTQALVNIINNAKDALIATKDSENRLLFITTTKKRDKVFISIKDNADGINETIINKIFEPYFTTKHKSQGTGLGLHMTYKLITETLNGEISIKNNSYSFNGKQYKGAEFIITLPLSEKNK